MSAILKNNFSVLNSAEFVNSIYSASSNLYIGVGRSAEWENEIVPPTPTDTIAEDVDFRNNLIGIKRVQLTNVIPIVPRVQWAAGMVFKPIETTAVNGERATTYYCINRLNYVYECIYTPSVGAVTGVGGEPDTMADSITTADGFKWKFLYDITPQMVNNNLLLDNWIPVPYNKHGVYPGGSLTANQHNYGDSLANITLSAYRVLINVTISDEGTSIPYTASFRQVGLLANPLDNSATRLAGDNYASTAFDTDSGELLYLENRRVINRMEGQSETLEMIITF
jgi:hypothetical protein